MERRAGLQREWGRKWKKQVQNIYVKEKRRKVRNNRIIFAGFFVAGIITGILITKKLEKQK
jgi:hypothetical protein